MFFVTVVSTIAGAMVHETAYSYRRRLYEGLKLGLLLGAVWPMPALMMITKTILDIDKIISDTVNFDPVTY